MVPQRIGNTGEQEDTEMGGTSIEVVNGQRGNGASGQSAGVQAE
jgi:hypothetical protein